MSTSHPHPPTHDISINCERGQYMLHDGHRARCSCGWSSDCYAQMSDTQRAIEVHLRRARRADFEDLIARSSIGAAIADVKARGIDAHLVDLEREMNRRRPTKKKLKEKKPLMKRSDFHRGALAAASVADTYDSTSTHPYRLGDCILAKLNIRKQKPRINRRCTRNERDSWLSGFAVALAEIHRQLLHGNNSTGVCATARAAGLTLKSARAAGVSAYDLKELKKAGIP